MAYYVIKSMQENLYLLASGKYANDYELLPNIKDATWFSTRTQAVEYAFGVISFLYTIQCLTISVSES